MRRRKTDVIGGFFKIAGNMAKSMEEQKNNANRR